MIRAQLDGFVPSPSPGSGLGVLLVMAVDGRDRVIWTREMNGAMGADPRHFAAGVAKVAEGAMTFRSDDAQRAMHSTQSAEGPRKAYAIAGLGGLARDARFTWAWHASSPSTAMTVALTHAAIWRAWYGEMRFAGKRTVIGRP